ncbi:MAG: serine hydrolase [Pseudomonadota bacterium]
MPIPQDDPLRCGLAWAAKVACSGKYLTGRRPQDVLRESVAWMFSDQQELEALRGKKPTDVLLEGVEVEADEAQRSITLRKQGRAASARLNGSLGAMVAEPIGAPAHFEPQSIEARPKTSQRLEAGETGIDQSKVQAALDTIFADPRQMTNAYLVVHQGRIVAERYREPFAADTRFESWSMGKSIAATLIGRLHAQGVVDLEEDGLFPEWLGADDPRRRIRLKNLLNMSSGLDFSGSMGRGEDVNVKERDGRFLDHIYVYASGCDSERFCLEKPQELEPGSAVRYRNCDPLLTMRLIRERAAGGDLAVYHELPQRLLFDELGASRFVLETDPFGGFLISGHDYGTAREWASVGQLWLQRGAWGGKQLLDPHYVDFALTPAPGSDEPYYGGFILLNRSNVASGLPEDGCWFSGGGMQRTFFVPSKELVIVRLGHIFGSRFRLDDTLQAANALLCDAVPA